MNYYKKDRDFSIKVKTYKGDEFHIMYGYNLSKTEPKFYVNVSINGLPAVSNKRTLNRIRKLGIEPLNNLITLIGRNETGVMNSYYNDAHKLLKKHFDINSVLSVLEMSNYLDITDEKSYMKMKNVLSKLVDMHIEGKASKTILNKFDRYLNTLRIGHLMKVRTTVQGLRKLYYNGIEIDGRKCVVRFEGYLKKNHYPVYYKRDIDLIRASRIRIYKNILKRNYRPVK